MANRVHDRLAQVIVCQIDAALEEDQVTKDVVLGLLSVARVIHAGLDGSGDWVLGVIQRLKDSAEAPTQVRMLAELGAAWERAREIAEGGWDD